VVEFNIFASVGTSEVDLAPYPGGSSKVAADKYRKIYAMVLSNTAPSANTLTIRIYRDTTLEASLSINLPTPGVYSVVGRREEPLLIVPPGRALKAIASAATVEVLMAGFDE
jgi:hypothetical protein